jgi:hypothetical protein
MRPLLWCVILGYCLTGCSALPDISHQPRYHNPFPQLSRVAILPFYNLSAEPTVDQDKIALAYYNELQAIRGFEVVPIGVTKAMLSSNAPALLSGKHIPAEEFQRLAQILGVDAVVVGAVTEYSPYYPPRLGLSVRWYAANPGFHPIPPGYGLPWGTCAEEYIPSDLVFDAEFALATAQLRTQSPDYTPHVSAAEPEGSPQEVVPASEKELPPARPEPPEDVSEEGSSSPPSMLARSAHPASDGKLALPPDWPDPRGFVPPPPTPERPVPHQQTDPVMTHTRLFHGNDSEFTEKLANYYYFRDDARFGDWQGYLQRSDDFIRFCCHLHISEMLTARGGAGESRVVWRWPIRRYER